MYSKLKNWKGPVEINGVRYENIKDAESEFKTLKNDICILLHSVTQNAPVNAPACPGCVLTVSDSTYKIEVKPYMTRKSTPSFDFMAKYNNDNPMPLRVMIGKVEKETPGMVYMTLHSDITQTRTERCMKCGKPITNSVSQFFGMGPECGGHNYINPFNTDEELKEAVEAYRVKLQNIVWNGWIPKSAILEKEIINE